MIIAFVAPKQFGKTTACNILKEHWGDDVVQVNFKDGLIAELKQNFPDLLREMVDWYNFNLIAAATIGMKFITVDDLFIIKPPLIRTLMQNYGTEVRRGDNPEYWTTEWIKSVAKSDAKYILSDDLRFNNEYTAAKAKELHGRDCITIRLNRTDKVNTDTHSSETEQEQIVCDYEITCGAGEFDKLKTELLKIVDNSTPTK